MATANGVLNPPNRTAAATLYGFFILAGLMYVRMASGASKAPHIHRVLGIPIFLVLQFIYALPFSFVGSPVFSIEFLWKLFGDEIKNKLGSRSWAN